MLKKIFVYISLIMFVTIVNVYAITPSPVNSASESTNNNNVGVTFGGPSGIINDIRTAPGTPGFVHNELPSYFGPFDKGAWNTQEDSILPFLLNGKSSFDIQTTRLWSRRNLVKSKVVLFTNEKFTINKTVKVVNGANKILGINYTLIGITTLNGNKKDTTVDCFRQALIDTGENGGNVFVLLKVNSTPAVSSSTWGLGGNSAGNFEMTGKDAYSAGSAIGYSSNMGMPVRLPFMHGIIVKVPDDVFKTINKNNNIYQSNNKVEMSESPEISNEEKSNEANR